MFNFAMKRYTSYLLPLAWITSIAATFGSLYYSDVLNLTPCVLCWWQRIFMYPLVILLAIGIAKKDKNITDYVLPLTIIGLGIAIYHYLLQRGILPESVAPCQAGISCTTKQIEYLGFITIPFLSIIAFAIISLSLFLLRKEWSRESR